MSSPVPRRPDQDSHAPDTSTAEALLIVLGGLAVLTVPMGVLGAALAGDTHDLLRPAFAAYLLMFAGGGVVMLLASRALRAGEPWGRQAAIAAFVVVALLAIALVVGVWLSPGSDTVDAAAYTLLGGVSVVGMSVAGLLSALRRTF